MLDFDVILGMDWLASHRATIDCYARTVIFGNVLGVESSFGTRLEAMLFADTSTWVAFPCELINQIPMGEAHHWSRASHSYLAVVLDHMCSLATSLA
ncbi:reverse transcriptase domain-containing protein [Tanacetum coccineum]